MAPEATEVLRQVNREIWIVTSGSNDVRGGCVATWISQASIDPDRPTIVAGIAPNHFTAQLIDQSGCFAAHLISPDQIDLAWRFGLESGRNKDKFQGLSIQTAETGSPILAESLSWLDCRVFYRLDAGDRIFYWADVVGASKVGHAAPLREHELFARATPDQLSLLKANLEADLAIQRPLLDLWRNRAAKS
jgi:flavin reductase (DIM6/NTAB) family NADH-FMN oxidoreductase RutF